MASTVNVQTNNEMSINRGKQYQIVLFPFNNAATNTYMALMSFVTYYGGYYLSGGFVGGLLSAAAMTALTIVLSSVVTGMRIFDGITDPFCGAMIDKTNGRFGKFRPYMIIGNLMLAVSVIIMYLVIRPVEMSWLRWTLFIFAYVVYVLGYTAQCAVTKAGQTCITNDPHQRSQFVVWNMVGMIGSIVLINLIGNGLLPIVVDPIDAANGLGAQYNPAFYDILVPITILVSALYTVLALIAIWKKDRPEFWGIDKDAKPAKFRDFMNVLKENNQIRWLVFSAGSNKLASTIATSGAVAVLIYYIMMGSYNGLYIPMYALSFGFMGLLFVIGAKVAGRKGQKRVVTQFTMIAFVFYLGISLLLSTWDPSNPSTHLSLIHWAEDNSVYFSINLITVVWIILFGFGYGAYNLASEMCIPMVADCTDYETYRTGNYVPGIMGTLFSLIDKLVSSLATLLLSVFTVGIIPALNGKLPSVGIDMTGFDFSGVKLAAIITFCLLPMSAWIVTMISMYFYKLDGPKLREIQAVNQIRKAAINMGMPKVEAMQTWKTIDQVPEEYVQKEKRNFNRKGKDITDDNSSIFDRIYHKIWGHNDDITSTPSSNPVPIPEKYLQNLSTLILNTALMKEDSRRD